MENKTWSPDAHAALLRDGTGTIVGTTYGGTACWFPKRPSRFAAVDDSDGSACVVRCGWCPGCREFDRQRLAQRLVDTYKEYEGEIWIIIVRHLPGCHPRLAASLHRSRRTKVEPGFYRLGPDHVAFLALGEKPAPVRLGSAALEVRIVRVPRSRGRRAWAVVTAGLMVHREEYGSWRNRFYHRGLKPLDRNRHWQFTGKGVPAMRYSKAPNVRAARGGVTIHLPEAIPISRLRRRKGPMRGRASDSESVNSLVAGLFGRATGGLGFALTHSLPASAKPTHPNRPINVRERARKGAGQAVKVAARGPVPHNSYQRPLNLIKGAGYQGSLQSTSQWANAWAERMAQKVRKPP